MKLTIEQLKEIIQQEIDAVTQEFKMPDTELDINLDPQVEPETKQIFKYTANKTKAQAFLQQQFQVKQ